MKMVDVGAKAETERVATATAYLRMQPETLRRIRAGEVEKGDVMGAARLAGIMATKRVPDLIPLCHPIRISGVEVQVTAEKEGVRIQATTRTVDRTGVEMESLTAASVAALTLYDMLKSYDRGMVIESVRLEEKAGGRSGHWRREESKPKRAKR
jgi:cyclic pyranopterin phosphate synthase